MTRWDKRAGQRLKTLIRDSGHTQTDFAQATGLSRTSLHRVFNGDGPGDAAIARFAAFLDITSDELRNPSASTGPRAAPVVEVPVYDMQVAAGAGRVADRLHEVFRWPFPTAWAQANLGPVENLMTFEVSGDSQWPEVTDGDLVVVDTRSRRASGDLHVVRVDDELKLKRIEADGLAIRLISRNELYPDEVIDFAQDTNRFEIIGRAVTAIKLF